MNNNTKIKVFSDGIEGIVVVNGKIERIKKISLNNEEDNKYILRTDKNEAEFVIDLCNIFENIASTDPHKFMAIKSELTNDPVASNLMETMCDIYNISEVVYPGNNTKKTK